MSKKAPKKALGRGLGALLDDAKATFDKELWEDRVLDIKIDKIIRNPQQPRLEFDEMALYELAESIREYGLLQPILLQRQEDESLVLIAGERRLRACKKLGLDSIRAVVLDEAQDKLKELALIENIQREDLGPMELALAYESLIKEQGLSLEDLGALVFKSSSQIGNTLRLLKLPKRAQQMLWDKTLSQGHAKVLVNLEEDDLNQALDLIESEGLTVAQTEALASRLKMDAKSQKAQAGIQRRLKKSNSDLEVKALSKGVSEQELAHLETLLDECKLSFNLSSSKLVMKMDKVNVRLLIALLDKALKRG